MDKDVFVKNFNSFFSLPFIGVMAGFGYFWFGIINHFNVWFSIIFGMYISVMVYHLLVLRRRFGGVNNG